jgi:hypothetical protein
MRALAIAALVTLAGCGQLTERPQTPPKERQARIAPGDLSDDQLEQLGDGEQGAQEGEDAAPATPQAPAGAQEPVEEERDPSEP